MKLSNRINNITGSESDGWEILYRSRQMMAEGVPVVELTIGEHDIKTEHSILDAMEKSARAGNTGYAMVPGRMNLRQTIAARIQERTGVPTSHRNVLITGGGQAALLAAHMAVLDHGDKALYCDPYYATYPGTIRATGGQDVPVQTHPQHDFQPQIAELEARAEGAVSLLINSPNNPTGAVYSRETLENIAGFSKRYDLWLISDEVYDTQIWQGEHISPRSLPDMVERTIVIGSMSKSHAMTGFRCGWIVAPEQVINRVLDLLTVNAYGVAGFVQDAAYFALTNGPQLEIDVAAPFRRRRDLAVALFKNNNAVRLVPSGGAMYLMLDIRSTGLSGIEFADRLLDEKHIATMPGESFGKAAAGHVRIAMTIEDSLFANALQKIIDFVSTANSQEKVA